LIRFILNDKTITTDLPPGTVLLDLIRYHQHLMGTKIGCREGDCGACTVLIGDVNDGRLSYQSMTSCLVPIGNVNGKHVVTIEGINFPTELNPIQQAMANEGATQCGFCTPGFVMSLAGFCLSDSEPTREKAIAAVDGNICRCTGYKSIERAAGRVAELLQHRHNSEPALFAAEKNILPKYFGTIKNLLQSLGNGAVDGQQSATGSPVNIVSGGTDLYVQKHDELTHADLRFVFNDAELKGIRKEGNRCFIGGSCTVTDLRRSPVIIDAFPRIQEYADLVSSTPIRNMATIAGNFVNASPIGDLTITFLALDAEVNLLSTPQPPKGGGRIIPLRRLYKGYKKLDKEPNDIITEISFDLPDKNTVFHFEKVSKRTHLDIASVNTAICLRMKKGVVEKAGLAAGGVAPIPLFLEKSSAFLVGKEISPDIIGELLEVVNTEISPISDARGTKEYKRLLLGQLIKAHFITLFPKMEEAIIG
jgi:xanthine dehydrogenase small subunit